jgi:hypothetical protein
VTRAPAALCLALVASDATATAEPCARATLSGDPSAVASVTTALRRLGVTAGAPTPGCPSIEAVVELDREGGFAVAIRAAGRSEGRSVSDAAMAAAWIESWVRDDVDGGWVAPPATTPAARPPGATPSVDTVVASSSFYDRIAIGVAYEQGWTDDGSDWTGASVSGCMFAGPVCVGGRVRASFQSSIDFKMSVASRSDVSVLATAALPFGVGKMSIAPELGVGVGRVETKRIDGCQPSNLPCMDPTDPNCMMMPGQCTATDPTTGKIYVGDHLDAISYTPRVALALRVALPLFDHVWLEGLAAASLAPFGHTEPFPPGVNPMGAMNEPASDFALPGEPLAAFQLGVGVRIGGR